MDDDEDYEVKVIISEREAAADGRPDVYTPPFPMERRNLSTGRRRMHYGYKDRLLLALRRNHGQPRYDLLPGIDYGSG